MEYDGFKFVFGDLLMRTNELMQAQHVAELVQRAQQLVPDVQQVGAQRCGHAPQVPFVILHALLQRGQRVVRPHAQTG